MLRYTKAGMLSDFCPLKATTKAATNILHHHEAEWAELIEQIATTDSAKNFLHQRAVLRRQALACPTCNRDMTMVKSDSSTDSVCFRCPSHKDQKSSIHSGSFLSHHHVTLKNFVLLPYFWAHEMPNYAATLQRKCWDCTRTQLCSGFLICEMQRATIFHEIQCKLVAQAALWKSTNRWLPAESTIVAIAYLNVGRLVESTQKVTLDFGACRRPFCCNTATLDSAVYCSW